MLRNYVKITWRNLQRQPGFTFINIVGLSAGLTCFTLIALWVHDELSYDTFHPQADRVVRLTESQKTETGWVESARTSAPMAKALLTDFADVENAVRLRRKEEVVQYQGQQWVEPNILLTDPAFFAVFGYRLTSGNPATALREPYSVVLTESTAKKYFGQTDPLGQVLTIFMYDSTGRGANYKVTGLTPDPPRNAHFTYTMLASFKTIEAANPDILTAKGWGDNEVYTYLLLKEGIGYQSFSKKIAHFYQAYIGELATSWRATHSYQLQPIRAIHLRSDLAHEIGPNGSIRQVTVFGTIGLFILLLAGVNYTNLATARSAGRAKEVGVKKAVGALRTQLIVQYLTESVFMAGLALLLSLLLSLLLQPFLGSITGKAFSLTTSPLLLLFLLGVTAVLGVLSGLYPAFLLSSARPVNALRGSYRVAATSVGLRQSLVVAQFVITIILITGIGIMYAQLRFIRHKALGYDQEALLYIRLNGNADVVKGYDAFRNDLTTSPFVAGVATSNSLLLNGLDMAEAQTVDRTGKPIKVRTAQLQVDESFLSVYGMRLLAGTDLTRRTDEPTGHTGTRPRPVLLNEQAVKRMGWKSAQDAIGKPFMLDDRPGTVVGVVRDFHFNSLRHTIEPVAICRQADYFSRITVKLASGQAGSSVALIESIWKKHFPSALFDYDFVDRQLAEQYRADERFSAILFYFSVLSLLIACLGLYGLITYATTQRTKEIGIRKTLGATVGGLVVLFVKDFLKPVVLAGFVAVPIAGYVMTRWLQDFAYKIEVRWWMFAASMGLVLVVALLTVSFQSIRAALMNPVKSLRTE